MSGITKLTKQLITVFILLIITAQFSLVSAASKSLKVSGIQSKSNPQVDLSAETQSESTNQALLNTERRSSYSDVSDPAVMNEQSSTKKPTYRDSNLSTQLKSSEFSIASTDVTMNIDLDGDGYFSDFSVNFDADTNYNFATVYALLYLSYEGGPWELYNTTDNFDLENWSSYDDYTVRTTLISGFPPGRYDILIDLYDTYDNSLVSTISSYDTYELADHYLEDTSYDNSTTTYSDFSIYDARITLLKDDDNDGFYQSFSLQFDADVESGTAMVYGEIWVNDATGTWQLEHTTGDFMLDGYSTLDTYILETVWESGYNTGYYDFSIEIRDAYSGELLTTSSAFTNDLSNVPLEDANADRQSTNNNSTNTVIITSYSEGSGGGSMGLLMLVLALPLAFRRMFK